MRKSEKVMLYILLAIALVFVVVAILFSKQAEKPPELIGTSQSGAVVTSIIGSYEWNKLGQSVTADSISPLEFNYGNSNMIAVTPGEKVTFRSDTNSLNGYKFYLEGLTFYDKDVNEIPIQCNTIEKEKAEKYVIVDMPEKEGTYIVSMKANYFSKGYAFYAFKVIVSTDPAYNIDKLISYKKTYIGNPSNVNAILELLPYSKYKDGIAMRTVNKPYELIVNYNDISIERNNLVNSSVAIFALIPNVDLITYNVKMDETSYVFSRQEIDKIVNRDVTEYAENAELWKKEVLFKDTTINSNNAESVYKSIIYDVMSEIKLSNGQYIAIDFTSFEQSELLKLSDVEKKNILIYCSQNEDLVIEATLETLMDMGMYKEPYDENTRAINGNLIYLESITENEGKYVLEVCCYTSKKDTKILKYELQMVDNAWNVSEI